MASGRRYSFSGVGGVVILKSVLKHVNDMS